MSRDDLTTLGDVLGIEPGTLAAILEFVREAVRQEVRDAAEAEGTLYTVADVLARVPWSRTTVDKMVRRGQIPMVYVSGRWVVTAAAFRAAAAAGFPVPSRRVQTRNPRAWLTVADVAERTGQKPETVQRKARVGQIPMFLHGKDWRMTPAAFDAWEKRAAAEGLPMEAKFPRRRPRGRA